MGKEALKLVRCVQPHIIGREDTPSVNMSRDPEDLKAYTSYSCSRGSYSAI